MVNTNNRQTWNTDNNAETYQKTWYVEEEEVNPNSSYYRDLIEQLLENAYSRGFTTEPDLNFSRRSNNLKTIPNSEVEVLGFRMNNTEDFVQPSVNEQIKEVGKSWGRKLKKSIVEPALKSGKKWLEKHL